MPDDQIDAGSVDCLCLDTLQKVALAFKEHTSEIDAVTRFVRSQSSDRRICDLPCLRVGSSPHVHLNATRAKPLEPVMCLRTLAADRLKGDCWQG